MKLGDRVCLLHFRSNDRPACDVPGDLYYYSVTDSKESWYRLHKLGGKTAIRDISKEIPSASDLVDIFWASECEVRRQNVYYERQNQTNGELEELNWTGMEKKLKGVEWRSTDNIHAELKLYPAGNGSTVRAEKKSLGSQGPKKDNSRNKSTPLTGAAPSGIKKQPPRSRAGSGASVSTRTSRSGPSSLLNSICSHEGPASVSEIVATLRDRDQGTTDTCSTEGIEQGTLSIPAFKVRSQEELDADLSDMFLNVNGNTFGLRGTPW